MSLLGLGLGLMPSRPASCMINHDIICIRQPPLAMTTKFVYCYADFCSLCSGAYRDCGLW